MKLEPCPFCGKDAELKRLGGEGSRHAWVECRGCGAEIAWYTTFEEAASKWNTRAAQPVGTAKPKSEKDVEL